MFKNKQAQTGGLITGLIFGVASLVIGVIIAFVIVSTLTGAGLLQAGRDSASVTAENGTINLTGYTLEGASANLFVSGSFTLTGLANRTSGLTIDLGNATVSDAGVVTNGTSPLLWNNVTFNYTYSLKSVEESSVDALAGNFSAGVDNVSNKIPTVLLVAAIVLILGVLAILVGVWQKMRIGGGNI